MRLCDPLRPHSWSPDCGEHQANGFLTTPQNKIPGEDSGGKREQREGDRGETNRFFMDR